jgi:DNA/RNA endonuclease YhcR with UshA esterase domain
MRSRLLGLLLVAGTVWATSPALAHHSFAAEYDSNSPVTVTGTVTKVEWANPHIYFYVDVKGADGTVANWAVEGATPNQLRRRGWGKDSLRVGDVVTVEGFKARKQGITHMNGRAVTLADGRRLFASGPEDAQ